MQAHEAGIAIGTRTAGTHNAITDVAGVRVGHWTRIEGKGPLDRGAGPVRTGVTVIDPSPHDVWTAPLCAGFHRLNGKGDMTGIQWLIESGTLSSPIALSNTNALGTLRTGLIRHRADQAARSDGNPTFSGQPVCGETNDAFLNDIAGFHVTEEAVAQALEAAAGGPVEQGSVGGGTGMICHDLKGGIGTASRLVPAPAPNTAADTGTEAATRTDTDMGTAANMGTATGTGQAGDYTVGVLVQANHGTRSRLTVNGAPVGALLSAPLPQPGPTDWRSAAGRNRAAGSAAGGSSAAASGPGNTACGTHGREPGSGSVSESGSASASPSPLAPGEGSIIVIVATDAPLLPHQLSRIAQRAGMGIARTGGAGEYSSGDMIVAFSTTAGLAESTRYPAQAPDFDRLRTLTDRSINELYWATIEATEEAIVNAMLSAPTMVGRDGNTVTGLDAAELKALLDRFGLASPPAAGSSRA